MIEPVLKIVLAYLLGSVSGSLLLGRLKHVDIRTMGSGNAGGTNALRTQGPLFALGVVVIDIGKGYLAARFIPGLDWFGSGSAATPEKLIYACGMAAIIGHCYPVWHGFRGGKGAATAVGVVLAISPMLLIPMLATWVVVLVITGYVSIATVISGFALVPGAWWLGGSSNMMTFTLLLALFMAFRHTSNFKALRNGTENRFEKVWLPNWFR